MDHVGRAMIVMGVLLALAGALFVFGGKIGLGRLPGDIAIEGKRGAFYFPIVTSLLLSVVLSVLLTLVARMRR